MGDHSSIEWTDATWNPVAGCTRVSDGCDNCYAATQVAGRLKNRPQYRELAVITPSGRAAFNGQIRLLPDRLEQPLRWRDPRRIFVNSMSDLFHDEVPDSYIASVFAVMAAAPQHTFQILTKRPARMCALLAREDFWTVATMAGAERWWGEREMAVVDLGVATPLANVWLGTSVEDQRCADERIPLLLKTPAAVRFLSAEPLLGPLELQRFLVPPMNVLWGDPSVPPSQRRRPTPQDVEAVNQLGRAAAGMHGQHFVDWVIVGGESGHHARPIDLAWVRAIVAQCRHAGVPAFVKQLGAVPMISELEWRALERTPILSARNRHRVPAGFVPLTVHDAKGGDMDEWPQDLQLRQYPEPIHA